MKYVYKTTKIRRVGLFAYGRAARPSILLIIIKEMMQVPVEVFV